jgi:hypothetical protein
MPSCHGSSPPQGTPHTQGVGIPTQPLAFSNLTSTWYLTSTAIRMHIKQASPVCLFLDYHVVSSLTMAVFFWTTYPIDIPTYTVQSVYMYCTVSSVRNTGMTLKVGTRSRDASECALSQLTTWIGTRDTSHPPPAPPSLVAQHAAEASGRCTWRACRGGK